MNRPTWSLLTQPERYVCAAKTNIKETFRALGWKPPSEHKVIPLPIKRPRQ